MREERDEPMLDAKNERRRIVRVRVPAQPRASYEIAIGAGTLDETGETARRVLSAHARRAAVISNQTVFDLYGARLVNSLREANFEATHFLIGDGERYKTLRTAERALSFLGESRIERSDCVVALGGGVVGDLAGFASAIHLRGVAFLQIPTTLLAMIDSSVGGKTGVNAARGKNTIGAFHQPRAVLIDTDVLKTLPARELTAGWCEAIKQAAVGDKKLFDATRAFLEYEKQSAASMKKDARVKSSSEAASSKGNENISLVDSSVDSKRDARLAELIASQCAFKARIVAGDERESLERKDARSRKILNFGHTVAHALEAVTNYKRFRHGEAVGYGIIAAGEISKGLAILPGFELESLRDAVRLAGRLPRAADLDTEKIFRALAADKKSIGGNIQWVLLERIGCARIVDGKEIAPRIIRAAIRAALKSTAN